MGLQGRMSAPFCQKIDYPLVQGPQRFELHPPLPLRVKTRRIMALGLVIFLNSLRVHPLFLATEQEF